MEIQIDSNKLMIVLEHCFSLHEADEISYMLTDDTASCDDIKQYLQSLHD